jgi:hypothetical protein
MRKEGLLSGVGIGSGASVALLAKAACPACYPAIAALFSSIGLSFPFAGPYFLAISALLFGVALYGLGYRAKSRRGYGPLYLGFAFTAVALFGQYRDVTFVFYTGVAGLALASIWNLFPKTKVGSCGACIDPGANPTQIPNRR